MALEVAKKVKNAVLYTNGCIRIDGVRASFPHLDKPYAGEDGGTPAYGLVSLLDKTTHKEAKDLIVERINEVLAQNKNAKVAADRKFIRNGDDSARDEENGHWTVSARETKRPSIRDKDKSVLSPEEALDKIYGGCFVNVLIRPWFQDNKYGKRVNAGLVAVQFLRDGEAFGEGRIDDEEAWDDVDDGNEGFTDDDEDGL
ncbi:DNA binding protein [Pseudomonas phage UF_RH7]|nr:DNA binding protein [Pseudomonas phage UF_RH7]